MRTLAAEQSLHTYWQQLTFTEAALAARPETAPMAAPMTTLLDEYDALRQRDLASQREVIRAHARVAAGDVDVDASIRDVHNDALHATGQDRSSQVFRALFKTHIAATVRFGLKRQLEVAAELRDALGLSIVPDTLRERHVPLLNEVIDRGRQALGERADILRRRMEVRLTIGEFKADVNAARLSLYGALLGHAAKHRLPKSWAASFFMRARTRSATASDIETEVELEEADTEPAPGDLDEV